MKVYCKDCKHQEKQSSMDWDIYSCKLILRIENTTMDKKYIKRDMNIENKNNNCIYFKPTFFNKHKYKGIADGKLSIVEINDTGGLSVV